jgi:ATP-dependent RNA helicase DeaD
VAADAVGSAADAGSNRVVGRSSRAGSTQASNGPEGVALTLSGPLSSIRITRRSVPPPMPKTHPPAAAARPSRHAAGPFASLGLSPAVLQAVEQLGFTEMSPIQAAAIPLIVAGHDLVGRSQTGSGKTAAFCIPAIERVDVRQAATQVLILAPTRELATQITDEVRKLAAFTRDLRSVAIYGGAAYERQFAELKRGAHVVVGTPGRLTDHMARGTLDLSTVKLLVLDEADRMLDMGFRDDIEKILAAAPAGRQTVFFSATISPPVQALVRSYSRDARTVAIENPVVGGSPVEQVWYDVRHPAKFEALARLIDFHDVRSGLIFCNTQRMVEELADALAARGSPAERLHGGMAQAQRTRVMDGFKRGAFRFLVATDVAARGIDVDDLALVVNYDLPYDAEDYVHRIGRTGRAGRTGLAVTLVSGGGIHKLRAIERFTGATIARGQVPTAAGVAARRADALANRLRETLAEGPHAGESQLVHRLVAEGHAPADVAAAVLHFFAPMMPPVAERDEFAAPPAERRRGPPPRRPPQRPERGRGGPGGPRGPGAPGGPGGFKRRKVGPGKKKPQR